MPLGSKQIEGCGSGAVPEGVALLTAALSNSSIGTYQLQAAIAAAS
jgi:predicted RNA polymerase sigma factor